MAGLERNEGGAILPTSRVPIDVHPARARLRGNVNRQEQLHGESLGVDGANDLDEVLDLQLRICDVAIERELCLDGHLRRVPVGSDPRRRTLRVAKGSQLDRAERLLEARRRRGWSGIVEDVHTDFVLGGARPGVANERGRLEGWRRQGGIPSARAKQERGARDKPTPERSQRRTAMFGKGGFAVPQPKQAGASPKAVLYARHDRLPPCPLCSLGPRPTAADFASECLAFKPARTTADPSVATGRTMRPCH